MLRFTRKAFKNHHEVGAFFPSGAALAKRMTHWLRGDQRSEPRRVLEVGAGTGPFTRAILSQLRDGDRLDVVELQPEFCEVLEKELLAPFRAQHPNITVVLHQTSVMEAPLEGPYDHVVCGLPFNNFPVAEVNALFEHMLNQMSLDGRLVYFAYMGMTKLKMPFMFIPRVRRSILARSSFMVELHRRCEATRAAVYRNLPPAWACTLRRASAAPLASA